MSQPRNKTGIDFEKEICTQKGWKHKSKVPRIIWEGKGRSNFDKLKSIDVDPLMFIPDFDKSKLEKYDALTQRGEKVEIKKYKVSDLNKFHIYSEPVIKIADKGSAQKALGVFGSKENYNKFIRDLKENFRNRMYDTRIQLSMIENSIGIQCIDGFIPKSDIEFKWEVCGGWKGWDRLTLLFKIKEKVTY
jgi:hypothetical protein